MNKKRYKEFIEENEGQTIKMMICPQGYDLEYGRSRAGFVLDGKVYAYLMEFNHYTHGLSVHMELVDGKNIIDEKFYTHQVPGDKVSPLGRAILDAVKTGNLEQTVDLELEFKGNLPEEK